MIDPDLAAGWQRRLEDRLGQFATRDLAELFAPAEAPGYARRQPSTSPGRPGGCWAWDSSPSTTRSPRKTPSRRQT